MQYYSYGTGNLLTKFLKCMNLPQISRYKKKFPIERKNLKGEQYRMLKKSVN